MAGQYLDEKNALSAEVERLTKERDVAQIARNCIASELKDTNLDVMRLAGERDRLSARVRELELTEEEREALRQARAVVSLNERRNPLAVEVLDRLVKGGR